MVNFLSTLYEQGLGYSALNTARSAISTIVTMENNTTCGEHKTVRRFMKGVFASRPALPRYSHTWDAETVLTHLDSLAPAESLSLKELTLKLTTLIALITGQRCQTIYHMDITHMQKCEDKFRFFINDLIKTSKPGRPQPVLILPKFTENINRCVFKTLEVYLEKTANIRRSNKLLLSYRKPHAPVHKETIGRWVKTILGRAGIDITLFKAHSTRAAATSAAKRAAVPMTSIMRAAAWQSDSTFRKFYEKPLQEENDFAHGVLNNKNR